MPTLFVSVIDKFSRRNVWLKLFAAILILSVVGGVPIFMANVGSADPDSAYVRATRSADSSVFRKTLELQAPGDTGFVTWSADGTKLATFSFGGPARIGGMTLGSPFGHTIMVWRADGTLLNQLTRPKSFFSVVETFGFTADGTEIVVPPMQTREDLAFSVFNVETGEVTREVGQVPQEGANGMERHGLVATSPANSVVASTSGAQHRAIELYSTVDWSKIGDLPGAPEDASETPTAMTFSSDGRLLAISRLDGELLIYDVENRKIISSKRLPCCHLAAAVSFSRDGKLIAVGGKSYSDALGVFKVESGERVDAYLTKEEIISSLSWSADDKILAYLSDGKEVGVMTKDNSGYHEQILELRDFVSSVAFSPTRNILAVANGCVITEFSQE